MPNAEQVEAIIRKHVVCHWANSGYNNVTYTLTGIREAAEEIAALRSPQQGGDQGAEAMRAAAKDACSDLCDAYQEASENHIQAGNTTKSREAMDWAIGALECAHAIAKIPAPQPILQSERASEP